MFKMLMLVSTFFMPFFEESQYDYQDNNFNEHIEFVSYDEYYDLELNESENEATKIVEDDYYTKDYYESNVMGSLGNHDNCDYYYFKSLTSFSIIINFNLITPYSTNSFNDMFKVELYDLFNHSHYYEIKRELKLFEITPGTYIIRVSKTEDFCITINYQLHLYVVRSVAEYNNGSIRDLSFNKQLLGAMWISDYNNWNDMGMLGPFDSCVYKKNACSNIKNTFDDIIKLSNNGIAHMATLYLWNDDLKLAIADICLKLYLDLVKYDSKDGLFYHVMSYNKKTKILDIAFNSFDTGMLFYTTFVDLSKLSSIAIGLGSSIAERIITALVIGDELNTIYTIGSFCAYLSALSDILRISCNRGYDLRTIGINFLYEIYESNNKYYFRRTFNAETQGKIFFEYSKKYFSNFLGNDDNNYDIIYSNIADQNSNPEKLTLITKLYGENSTYNYRNYYNAMKGRLYGISNLYLSDINSINNYTNIEIDAMNLNLSDRIKIDFENVNYKAIDGQYYWFKFIAPSNNKYYFKFEAKLNRLPLIVDFFTKQDSGYDENHLISTFNSKGNMIEDGDNYASYCDKYLYKDEILYLRVHCEDFAAMANCYFLSVSLHNPQIHSHMYQVETYNGTHHKYVCSCGDYYLEKHQVKNGKNRCIICGAKVSGGIIQHSIGDEIEEVDYDEKAIMFIEKKEELLGDEDR